MGADDAQPFTPALAPDPHRGIAEVEVPVVEAHELPDAAAGGVHQLQDRPVA